MHATKRIRMIEKAARDWDDRDQNRGRLGRLVFIRPVSLSDEYEANACFMSCPY